MTRAPRLVALAVLLSLAACGGGARHVPKAQLESQLVALEQGKKLPYTVGGATCPGDLPDTVGAGASCTIVFDGVTVPIQLTLASTTGGAQISATIPVPVIELDAAQKVLVSRSNALTGKTDATADCLTMNGGKPVLVTTVGATFTCSVVTGGATHTVTVKVNDVSGSVAITAQDGMPIGGASPSASATP